MQQPIEPPNIRMPQWPYELGSLTDWVSIAIGVVVLLASLFVAGYQIWLMKRQMRLMVKADAISRRQWRISRRQDQMMRTKEARRPRFEVYPFSPAVTTQLLEIAEHGVQFELRNEGIDAARNVHWMLAVSDSELAVTFRDNTHQKVVQQLRIVENGKWWVINGSVTDVLFRETGIDLPSVLVGKGASGGALDLLWQVHCDGGTFPESGFGRVRLNVQPDGTLEPQGGWKAGGL